ncbi:hypothetical protein FAM18168_01374 [Lacticaseibacillus paracasei]|nr:hypothetical protein FAM18149_01496 [Lacticaseibacillus paracasei]RND84393.1 hypothetical protein FAM18168_01374 [Lacticaseibacillus paracasei]
MGIRSDVHEQFAHNKLPSPVYAISSSFRGDFMHKNKLIYLCL